MPTARGGDDYDTTSLTGTTHGWRVHRDYLAHVIRWGWASRFIGRHAKYGARRVIEPGCGPATPLFGVMRSQASFLPEFYVGIDLGTIRIEKTRSPSSYKWATFHSHFNFVERWQEIVDTYGPTFDLCVSTEVIEHMAEQYQPEYLRGCYEVLRPGGTLLLSTPVFNGKMAKNHVRELTVAELDKLIRDAGFTVEKRYGTFASYHDVKKGIRELYPDTADDLLEVYEGCRKFYDDNLLAAFLAPLVPDFARNNAWVCQKPGGEPPIPAFPEDDVDLRYEE